MIGPEQFACFGFGSLVNRATHHENVTSFVRVRLKGWRRHWLPRPAGKFGHVALLSVYRDPDCEIDGLLIIDHKDNLPALDVREIRYDRIEIRGDNFTSRMRDDTACQTIPDGPVCIYQAKKLPLFENNDECRILRSYLDTVMQGYCNEFGLEGLEEFIDSTDNFEIGIREDRKNPVYSRPVALNSREIAYFDRLVPPSA